MLIIYCHFKGLLDGVFERGSWLWETSSGENSIRRFVETVLKQNISVDEVRRSSRFVVFVAYRRADSGVALWVGGSVRAYD